MADYSARPSDKQRADRERGPSFLAAAKKCRFGRHMGRGGGGKKKEQASLTGKENGNSYQFIFHYLNVLHPCTYVLVSILL